MESTMFDEKDQDMPEVQNGTSYKKGGFAALAERQLIWMQKFRECIYCFDSFLSAWPFLEPKYRFDLRQKILFLWNYSWLELRLHFLLLFSGLL